MRRNAWTLDELEILKQCYKDDVPIKEILKLLPNRTSASVIHKAKRMGYVDMYVKKHNSNYTAEYQNYEWCYNRYVELGMTHKEMAAEAGVSLRVIQKWCVEKFGLHGWSFAKLKKLSSIQKEIITAGTLGDGHIDRRDECPIYIESHSQGETDYLFWKYEYLKDLCGRPPKFHPEQYFSFGRNKKYHCKSFHRLVTRKVNELIEIKNIPRIEKIKNLSSFGLSLHVLDDGSRGNCWIVCLAEWTKDEIQTYINICREKFELNANTCGDERYICFDASSSRKLDQIILSNVPNHLDIIKKKILNNDKICTEVTYRYVLSNGDKYALGKYCKMNHLRYNTARDIMENILCVIEVDENILLKIYSEVIGDEV